MRHAFIALIAALSLTGCANTSEWLSSEPVTHYKTDPASAKLNAPGWVGENLTLTCMKRNDNRMVDEAKQQECLYISVEASSLSKVADKVADKGKKRELVDFLVSVSDMNCSTFMHRVFANKGGMDFSKGVMSDLANAISAGTVHANPATSATFSGANIILGHTVDNLASAYYLNKSFQALEAAILAERTEQKTAILKRLKAANEPYSLYAILSDIRSYDDACSFRGGLSRLAKLAEGSKNTEEAALKSLLGQ
ncbi:hypothetical protein EDC61_10663 [Sulfuritortus calidifontis]|uniref:Lipoprotein n=1 Tax=Sulfuritortus calidifontis TaxID=1914471 RepID=A0A4R3JVQ7_9PROT|nr:hypothetical protein [Sulfuritortus calidifontis]TCS72148.1 hypothetical protein EDC61_10663 [Sulfuritortus calidifontis]